MLAVSQERIIMKVTSRACRRASAFVASFLAIIALGSAHPAMATDLDSDDYLAGASPPGTNLALVYLQHTDMDQINANGKKVADGNLTSDIAILRYAHFVNIGPFRADPQFLLPMGQIRGSGVQRGLGKNTGVGDLILGATIWLINKPEKKVFFGVTPFVYLPTGSYDHNRSLNLGDNRWKFVTQAAFVVPIITKKLTFQMAADYTFYTANNNYGIDSQRLTQKPLLQLQAWLMYQISPKFDFRVGSSHFSGGITSVDGVRQQNFTKTTNFKVGAGWNFTKNWNLVAIYGRDAQTENGFQETTRFNLRLLRAF
jgi:hypothetical protein